MFRVGQKVVCVDDGSDAFGGWNPCGDRPVKGETYTVAKTGRYRSLDSVFLVEIRNGSHGGQFRAARFRPVVERKTDISIFKAMLNPAKKKRRADRVVTVS